MVKGEDLVVCNSALGNLHSIKEKRDIWSVDGGGFITRGLASASGCYCLVEVPLPAGLIARIAMPPFAWWIWRPCVPSSASIFRGLAAYARLSPGHRRDIHGGAVIRVPHRLLEQGSAASAVSRSQRFKELSMCLQAANRNRLRMCCK